MGERNGKRGAWGQGRVFLRGNTYWIQFQAIGADGTPKQIKETTRIRIGDPQGMTRAKAILAGRVHKKAVPVPTHKATFVEAAKNLVQQYDLTKERNMVEVRYRFTHLHAFFGQDTLVQITRARIMEYLEHRQEKAENATIRQELSILRRTLALAQEDGRLETLPAFPRKIKVNPPRAGFIEPGSFEQILAQLEERFQPVALFGYITGWRVQSEVLPLERTRVSFEAGTVRLDPGSTKNDEGRVFPFAAHPRLKEILETQENYTRDAQQRLDRMIPYVFHQEGERFFGTRGEGYSLDGRVFARAFTKACAAAGYPGLIVHDMRRSAVRNLIRAGVAQSVAMKITGHKTDRIFRDYDIVSEEDTRTAVAKLYAESKLGTIKVQKKGKLLRFKG